MTRARIALVLALVAAGLSQAGCQASAMKEVRAHSAMYAEVIEKSPAMVADAASEAYLDDIAATLLGAAKDLHAEECAEAERRAAKKNANRVDPYDGFHVKIVHSEMENAWTYGDDYAVVTTGLLLNAESPEEVAAVLAHEFGHVRKLHLVEDRQREARGAVLGVGLVALGVALDVVGIRNGVSAPSGSMTQATSQLAAAFNGAYASVRPADEHEADLDGLEIYLAAGYDGAAYDDIFMRWLSTYGESRGGTHPTHEARVHRIREHLAAHPQEPSRSLDPAAFGAMQARVAGWVQARGEAGALHEWAATMQADANRRITKCCGPLFAESDEIAVRFHRALAEHGAATRR